MTRTPRMAALLIVFVIATVGCSGGDDTPERAQTVGVTTAAGGETTTTAGSIDQAEVEAALLTIEDVPTG